MKERPILFQGAMVRALLAGTKTQTRRALRMQPDRHHWESIPGYELKKSKIVTINDRCAVKFSHSIPQTRTWETALDWLLCPYGQPGDQLWVRETWCHFPENARDGNGAQSYYRADQREGDPDVERVMRLNGVRWRPSIHMPRKLSRITLEVTDVRVERLQSISEADAAAEGLTFSAQARRSESCMGIYELRMPDGLTHFDASAVSLYRKLWGQINGPGSWDANPWVWVVEFAALPPLAGQKERDRHANPEI